MKVASEWLALPIWVVYDLFFRPQPGYNDTSSWRFQSVSLSKGIDSILLYAQVYHNYPPIPRYIIMQSRKRG
jgi:hypothetical protein